MNYRERITSPVGSAVWPKLNKPETKFDPDGVYEVKLRLNGGEAKPFIEKLTKHFNEYKSSLENKKMKIAPMPWREVEDDDGSPSGDFDFKFKLKAIGGSRGNQFEQRPVLLDSSGNPMSEQIGAGSRIQIGAEVVGYNSPAVGVGITLRIKAVMVHSLEEYTGSVGNWEFDEGGTFKTESSDSVEDSQEVPQEDAFGF